MKKWLLFFASFALLVAISFFSYLYVKRAAFVSDYLSKTFGSCVTVQSFSLGRNGLTINNLKSDFFQCRQIRVKMDLAEQLKLLFGNEAVKVRRVSIYKPHFLNAVPEGSSRTFVVKKIVLEKAKVKNFKRLGLIEIEPSSKPMTLQSILSL